LLSRSRLLFAEFANVELLEIYARLRALDVPGCGHLVLQLQIQQQLYNGALPSKSEILKLGLLLLTVLRSTLFTKPHHWLVEQAQSQLQ
jgi:hypothetical protein